MIFGKHLILRIDEIEKYTYLNDKTIISNFLKLLVNRIGMRVLAGPLVGYESSEKLKEGCSGLILLYESHAAIHTYVNQHAAFIDIFSCKAFEKEIVVQVIEEVFGKFTIVEEEILTRGHHWNKGLSKEYDQWTSKK